MAVRAALERNFPIVLERLADTHRIKPCYFYQNPFSSVSDAQMRRQMQIDALTALVPINGPAFVATLAQSMNPFAVYGQDLWIMRKRQFIVVRLFDAATACLHLPGTPISAEHRSLVCPSASENGAHAQIALDADRNHLTAFPCVRIFWLRSL